MTYAHAVSTVGERMVFELRTLVGYDATLALQLRVFRVPGALSDQTRKSRGQE